MTIRPATSTVGQQLTYFTQLLLLTKH